MNDQEILDRLEVSLATDAERLPTLLCSVRLCADAARFCITSVPCGAVSMFCARHRGMVRADEVACGTDWIEAAL